MRQATTVFHFATSVLNLCSAIGCYWSGNREPPRISRAAIIRRRVGVKKREAALWKRLMEYTRAIRYSIL